MTVTVRRLSLPSPEATARLGQDLARLLRRGDAVLMDGGLGSGKTHLARAIVQSLAGADQDVPSPTFTLIQRYDTPKLTLTHCDLYRVAALAELEELGLDEALEDGALLAEWPDRAKGLWPNDRLEIALRAGNGPEARTVTLTGHGTWAERLDTWMPRA